MFCPRPVHRPITGPDADTSPAMNRLYCLVLLSLCATFLVPTASADPSQAPTCLLDPNLRKIRDLCDQGFEGDYPATCPTLRMLEYLINEQHADAHRVLAEELGFPDESIDRLGPFLKSFRFSFVDDDSPVECAASFFAGLGDYSNAALQDDLLSLQTLIVMGRILGISEQFLKSAVKIRHKGHSLAYLDSFSFVLKDLLEKTESGWTTADGLASSPLSEMIFGSEGMHQKASRDLSTAAHERKPLPKATLLVRAGLRFANAGSYEESLSALHRARDILDGQNTDEAKALKLVAMWYTGLQRNILGLPPGPNETGQTIEDFTNDETRDFLSAWGKALIERDYAPMNAFNQRVMAGEFEIEKIEVIFHLYENLFPEYENMFQGGSSSSFQSQAGLEDYTTLVSQITENLYLRRFEEAASSIERILERYPGHAQYVFLMGIVAAELWLAEQRDEAIKTMRLAMEILEGKIDEFQVDDIQQAFIGERVHLFFYAAVHMAALQGQAEEAFDYAERGRAWATRRLLGGPRNLLRQTDPETAQRGRELLDAVHEVEDARRQAPPDQWGGLDQELARRRVDFLSWRLGRKLAAADNRPAADSSVVDLQQLQEEILDENTTLVAYAGGLEGVLWSWVVSRHSIEMIPLEMPETARLLHLGQSLRDATRPGPRLDFTHGLLEELHGQLIGPLIQHLGQREKLILVPFGQLHQLPFAALRHPETHRYLVQDYTLTLAPSASSLASIVRPDQAKPRTGALVLGDPTLDVTYLAPLDGARQEAKTVSTQFRGEPLLGARASEGELRRRVGETGWLHLAVHGTFDRDNPAFSRLWLAGDGAHDGRLEVHEVWDELDLSGVRLVALSGCETALGQVTRGDEIVGLTQAFLIAGSRSVLSTLWRVDDVASEKLVGAFYRQLKDGATAAQALAAAQREMIADSEHGAPYFWAGYTLSGDPDTRWPASSRSWRSSAMLFVAFLVLATPLLVVFPNRFPPRLAVLFASRDDLSDGEIRYLRPASRRRGRLRRHSETYLAPHHGPRPHPEGAVARLLASGRSILLTAMPGHDLWRRENDGTWTPLLLEEQAITPGTLYRNASRSFFFQLRKE